MKANLSPEQVVEMQAVDGLAEKLLAHIVATKTEIANLHVHGAKSKAIQDCRRRLKTDPLSPVES